jgi:hypothetical protein
MRYPLQPIPRAQSSPSALTFAHELAFVWTGWFPATRVWGFASGITVASAFLWFAIVSAAALRAPVLVIPALFVGSLLGLALGWAGGSRDVRLIKKRLTSEALVITTWRDPHPVFISAYMVAFVLVFVSVLLAVLEVPLASVLEVPLASVSFLACGLATESVFRFLGLREAEREMGPIEVGRGVPGLDGAGYAYRLKSREA